MAVSLPYQVVKDQIAKKRLAKGLVIIGAPAAGR
jgi:hypothetical protein